MSAAELRKLLEQLKGYRKALQDMERETRWNAIHHDRRGAEATDYEMLSKWLFAVQRGACMADTNVGPAILTVQDLLKAAEKRERAESAEVAEETA